MKKMNVLNSRGEQEPFSLEKVRRSCIRSGADARLADEVAKRIKGQVYDGIKTSEVYRMVKKYLKQSPAASMKFSLKHAMRKLGPSGFDFEKYIGEIFEKSGYRVKTNQFVAGRCISNYEIDFKAEKEALVKIGECKYHTFAGARVDLQVALYNYARFLDIKSVPGFENSKAVLVTNTKFTSEAAQYSECVGIELLGWRYPRDRGLEHLIEKHKLYPVTILPSFKTHHKDIFAQKKMMIVSDLLKASPGKTARKLGLPSNEVKRLVEEAGILLE